MRFVVVPQWQGSGSSRAMRLADGAHAVHGDLPARATTLVEVPVGAGDALGTRVPRLSSVLTIADQVDRALRAEDSPAVVVGGDCGVELAAVRRAATPTTALVWFGARPALRDPSSTTEPAFAGSVLRVLVDEADDDLPDVLRGPGPGVAASRVVLAGVRSWDDDEDAWAEQRDVAAVSALDFSPDELVEAVAATGATELYLHVDLDVLDPAVFRGLLDPQPFGLDVGVLVASIVALRERWPLAGAGVCAFAPADADAAGDDLGTILRVVGALSR